MSNKNQASTPKCFESLDQWAEYQRLWIKTLGSGKIDFCHDCLPEYRDQMIRERRCSRPETVFVEGDDGPVGVSGMRWWSWVAAVSGKKGNIVSMPDRAVRDEYVAQKMKGFSIRKRSGDKRLKAL